MDGPKSFNDEVKQGSKNLNRAIRPLAAVGALTLGLAAAVTTALPASAAPYTDQEFISFTASNGQSSQYHVYAQGITQPSGLLIWTHGDGAYEFEHPDEEGEPYVMTGTNGLRAEAKGENYILVSALAPDPYGTTTWWENGANNADYMADLITHLQGEYNINSYDIVLAGFSGGAQFTTQYFLPEYSDMLDGGGSIVFGGGGAPETPDQEPWNQALKSNFYMHWATGALDDAAHSDEDYDALGYAQDGVAYYDNQGFDTSYYWIPGHDHVIDGLFGQIVGDQLRAHPASQPTGWSVDIDTTRRYAYITVDIPSGTIGTTTVRAEGPGGSYWYVNKTGTGQKEFRMGDPGDRLNPNTTYTYTVKNGGTIHASGSFTTDW